MNNELSPETNEAIRAFRQEMHEQTQLMGHMIEEVKEAEAKLAEVTEVTKKTIDLCGKAYDRLDRALALFEAAQNKKPPVVRHRGRSGNGD